MHSSELKLENYFIEKLTACGWVFIDADKLPRIKNDEPLLTRLLEKKLAELNASKGITDKDIRRAVTDLHISATGQKGATQLIDFYKRGIPSKYETDKVVKFSQLFDYDNIAANEFNVSRQVTHIGASTIRNDIILYVNGIPLVSIELKSPTNPAESWVNALNQINDYKKVVPELYKYLQIGVAANSEARYFPIVDWRDDVKVEQWKDGDLNSIDSVIKMLKPASLLDIIRNFLFVRIEKSEATKILPRYMQIRAVNKAVQRVQDNLESKTTLTKGLIWHWQGSGKTYEIITTVEKLRELRQLENPTTFIMLDRDDLQNQIFDEYAALNIKSMHLITNINMLKKVIAADNFKGQRGVFIVLIQKFQPDELMQLSAEIKKHSDSISERKNVVCLIDEGHRSQYGLLAAQMKSILRNAFFFAFTGTPVSNSKINTYAEFSNLPDEKYLDKYFIDDSIADGFTKKLVKKSKLDDLHLSKESLDAFLSSLVEEIPEEDREEIKQEIRQKLNRVNMFLEDPERIGAISKDIASHFLSDVKSKYKAMIVAGSRKACVLYKEALDKVLPPSTSEIVMTFDPKKDAAEPIIADYCKSVIKRNHGMEYDQIRKQIIENFKEEEAPEILIVTDMLLTGFDSPWLQTMYLDKPLKNQKLLQAIARTNRPYKEKEFGLIIDYVGIFDRIDEAMEAYANEDIRNVIVDFEAVGNEFVKTIDKLNAMLDGISHDYEIKSLQAAIEMITATKQIEDEFTKECKRLRKLYEFLGSNDIKLEHIEQYKWLMGIYFYYIKVVVRDEDHAQLVKKYFRKTLELIHSQTQVKELIESPAVSVIDENYLLHLKQKMNDKHVVASNLVFALNGFILVDKHKNIIYESLIERVEKLVAEWKERINAKSDTSEQASEAEAIYNEVVSIKQLQKKLDLNDTQMAIWISMKNSIGFDDDEEILSAMKGLFEELKPLMIPDFQHNMELRKMIETKMREFLFVKVRPKYPMTLEKVNAIHKSISEKMEHYGD